MGMTRVAKENLVVELKKKFTDANAAFLTEYRGMTVPQMGDLRRKIHEGKGEYKVIKNRIARIAAQGTDFEEFSKQFAGPIGLAFSYEDPVAVAKAVLDNVSDASPLKLLSGAMDAQVLDKAEVDALSKLPDRHTLLSMTAGVLAAPIRDFACVMAAVPRDFVNVLTAIKKEKEKQ